MSTNIFTTTLRALTSLFSSSSSVKARPVSPATSNGSTAIASSKGSTRSASTAVDNGIQDFALGEEMAHGPYGPRFRAHDLTSNRSEVCVEKIVKEGLSKTLRKLLKQEIRVSDTNGGALLPGGVIRAFEDDEHYYLVRRPFVRTLVDDIEKNGRFPARQSVVILAQMVSILESLHAQHVYPADLSPSAFVIDGHGLLSLGHLCGARDKTASSYVGFKGTFKSQAVYEYGNAAPEMILGAAPSRSTVVFGIAACWHYVAFGVTRYAPGIGKSQLLKDLKERSRYSSSVYPQGWDTTWEEMAYSFLDKALLFDPAKRTWIDALKSHPILSTVDWKTFTTSPLSRRPLPHLSKATPSRSLPSPSYHPGRVSSAPASYSHSREALYDRNARGVRPSAPRVAQPSRSVSVPGRAVRAY